MVTRPRMVWSITDPTSKEREPLVWIYMFMFVLCMLIGNANKSIITH